MRSEEFEFLYELEETFWWFAGMRQITDAVLSAPLRNISALQILDAGCGAGYNIAHYASLGSPQVFGLDLSEHAISWVRKRGIRKVTRASVTEIPYASASFDVVLSFDVICQGEHPPVDDGLREMQRILKPGGSLFVRVPAFSWMRSSHDVEVDTNRRFTRRELVRELSKAGLNVEWISYANCILFPVVVLRRMLKSVGIGRGSDVRPLPGALGWVNPVFQGILGFEASLFKRHVALPFGLSLVCLARKPYGT